MLSYNIKKNRGEQTIFICIKIIYNSPLIYSKIIIYQKLKAQIPSNRCDIGLGNFIPLI